MPGIQRMCTLTADLSGLLRPLQRSRVKNGPSRTKNTHFRIEYSVEIFFGGTSLCASILWKEEVSFVTPTH